MHRELIDNFHGWFRTWFRKIWDVRGGRSIVSRFGTTCCLLVMLAGATLLASPGASGEEEEVPGPAVVSLMPDSVRSSISKIVIIPTDGSSSGKVTGTYDQETAGVLGGMAKGSELGRIPVEVGQVPINIPIPILRELGMLVGAIRGGTDRQIQEFRDRLTEDLRSAVDQPLTNDSLANDVYWGLRKVSTLEPKLFAPTTPVPEDTDAILYVAITDLGVNVQKNEAIISLKAVVRVDRHSDGATLYRGEITYQDRDTLSNWIKDEAILWREYRRFARHYIGREIAAVLYERINVDHDVAPAISESIKASRKDSWSGKAKTQTPTLVWSSKVNDAGIDAEQITWDVEIYDRERPVYSANGIRGTSHTLSTPLEACGNLYWSVRPTYTVDGESRVGRWMRKAVDGGASNGNAGRSISTAHAYLQDFASFEVNCK